MTRLLSESIWIIHCSSSQSMHWACRLLPIIAQISLISIFQPMCRTESTPGLQDAVARVTMLQRYDITPGPAPGLGSSTLGTQPAPAIRVSQEVLWCHPLYWYHSTDKRMAVDTSLKVSLLWNFTQSLYLMAFSEWRKWDWCLFDRLLAHSWV